jgi:hypothetical protein
MGIMKAQMAVHNQRRWITPLHLCVATVPTLLSFLMIAACQFFPSCIGCIIPIYTHLYMSLLCLPIFLLFVCRRQVPSVTTVQNIARHKTIPSPYLWTSSVNHQNKMEDSDDNNNSKNRQMAHYLQMKSLVRQSRGNGYQQPLHGILNQICKLLLHLWTWHLNNSRHWRSREQMKLVVDVVSAL